MSSSRPTFRRAQSHRDTAAWGFLVSKNPKRLNLHLIADEYSFGRDSSNIIKLPDVPQYSKNHFSIIRRGANVTILDQSSNGTYLNGVLIGKHNSKNLIDGDLITLLMSDLTELSDTYTENFFAYLFEEIKENKTETLTKETPIEMDYFVGDEIGSGGYGVVCKVFDKKTNQVYAGKKIALNSRISADGLTKIKNQLIGEVGILRSLRHPNIVELKGIYCLTDSYWIVMEYVPGGDIFDRIMERQFYSQSNARECVRQILTAVSYLHQRNIVHRDLKPENILLVDKHNDANIKVGDFGLSRLLVDQRRMYTRCGSILYTEIITSTQEKGGYTPKVDEWSIGIILYVLLSGCHPFQEESDSKTIYSILHNPLEFPADPWDSISPQAIDLIQGLLHVNPDVRISCEGALNHYWFKEDLLQTMTEPDFGMAARLQLNFGFGSASEFPFVTATRLDEERGDELKEDKTIEEKEDENRKEEEPKPKRKCHRGDSAGECGADMKQTSRETQ